MRALAIVGLIAGCGRLGFEPIGTDATTLAAAECWYAWRSEAPQLSPPVLVQELVNGTDRLTNPSFGPDRLTLYYETNANAGDLMMATRSDVASAWGNVRPISELDTATGYEGRLSISADGLTALYVRGNPTELAQATRTSANDPFSPGGIVMSSPLGLVDPELPFDGSRLYYSALTMPQTIELVERASVSSAFQSPVEVVVTNMIGIADPSLSPDELVMVFSSTSGATRDIYYAVRDRIDDPFRPPHEVPGVNGPGDDGDADISWDGCEVIFSSNRVGRELWVSRVIL
jgi:hypothetical protein